MLTLADCGGFLLLDYLANSQPRDLPDDVLRHIDRVWPMITHPFVALHVAGVYATAAERDGLARCRQAVLASPPGARRETSLGLVSALDDLVAGEAAGAAQALAPLSPSARIGIGGSNVERILVELIETAARRALASSAWSLGSPRTWPETAVRRSMQGVTRAIPQRLPRAPGDRHLRRPSR